MKSDTLKLHFFNHHHHRHHHNNNNIDNILIETIRIYSQDIGMEFGIEKRVMKKGTTKWSIKKVPEHLRILKADSLK